MLEIVCYKRTQTQRVRRKNYMALLRSAASCGSPPINISLRRSEDMSLQQSQKHIGYFARSSNWDDMTFGIG